MSINGINPNLHINNHHYQNQVQAGVNQAQDMNSLQGLYSSGVMNTLNTGMAAGVPVVPLVGQAENSESVTAAAAGGSSVSDMMAMSQSGSSVSLRDNVVNSICGSSASETGSMSMSAAPSAVRSVGSDEAPTVMNMSANSLSTYFSGLGMGEEAGPVVGNYMDQYSELSNKPELNSLMSGVVGSFRQ
ncbi:hypothetical protein IJT93_12495 [bacterium]|nr:hypothetical protein [bacterium]